MLAAAQGFSIEPTAPLRIYHSRAIFSISGGDASIALEAPHIVEPLGQFYVDLLLASATRVPMPILVKIAWLVAWMIVMLSGHLLLAILVAMAMLIQVAWCVAWMIVMLARFFLCHHLLLLLRSARNNAHGWAIVPTTHVMRQP